MSCAKICGRALWTENSKPKGGSKMEVTVAAPKPTCPRERQRVIGQQAEEGGRGNIV